MVCILICLGGLGGSQSLLYRCWIWASERVSNLRFPLRLSPHQFPASHSWTLNAERKQCHHLASLAGQSAADRRYVWIHGLGKRHWIEVFPRSTGLLCHRWYLASGTRGCIKLHWTQRMANLSGIDNEVSRWTAVDTRAFLSGSPLKMLDHLCLTFTWSWALETELSVSGKLYWKGTNYNKLDSLDTCYLCLTTCNKTFLSSRITLWSLTFTSSTTHILGWTF